MNFFPFHLYILALGQRWALAVPIAAAGLHHCPKNAFPNLPLEGSSPKSPWILEHFSFPGSSRKHVSMALTAFRMEASSPFSCQ